MRKKRFLGFEEASEWKDRLLPNFDPNIKEFDKNPWITTFFLILTLVFFFIIFLRLTSLQIVKGGVNRELADGNRIQIKIIHAPRGVIFDRNNKILAANSPAFRLFDKETNKTKLITREEALKLEVKNDPALPDLEVDNVRSYPNGEKLAHVVGYVGEISPDQLKSSQFAGYLPGDRIGQSGVEAQYESILKGKDGGEIIETDSKNNKLRILRRVMPIPGENIYLTIDKDLQEKVYQFLKDAAFKSGSCCGAAIAVDPTNGQILSLVSIPSFDPNIFTKYQDEQIISELFQRSDYPILNRAIAGTYPPGSTFKIISSIAAITSNKITPQTEFLDTGEIYLGAFRFSNWYFNQYGKTEGPVNLVKAIKRSTDTYFYQVAQILGLNPFIAWARKLHLGEKTGIDIPGEVVGLVPDETWKLKNTGEIWYPGDTLHLSIGQGYILTTPLQILNMTSFVASDGILYKPKLLLKLDGSNSKKEVMLSNIVSKEQLISIKQGLSEVPKAGGTAWPFFTFPIQTAGKTGTAEYGDPKNRTHAWYTSYAPADDPKIAMTVLIEGGGEGSSVAAPVAKEIMRWFFSPDKNKLIQDIYTPATDSARILGE